MLADLRLFCHLKGLTYTAWNCCLCLAGIASGLSSQCKRQSWWLQ